MIKLEHVVLASPEQMAFMIEGIRNIDCSLEESDSFCNNPPYGCNACTDKMRCTYAMESVPGKPYRKDGYIGPNDHSLMQRLANACIDYRKFLRMMPVYVRITAPLYWWNEFDSEYGDVVVTIPCSFMHKILKKKFTLEDFSTDHLTEYSLSIIDDLIYDLNIYRHKWILIDNITKESSTMTSETRIKNREEQKDIWKQIIQLLPNSYNETRNVKLDYAVLADIYHDSKRDGSLDEWWELCSWIEQLPYAELICGDGALMTPNETREKIGLEPIEEPSESLKMLKVGKAAAEGIQKGINRPNPLTTEALIKLRMVEPWS